MGSLITSRFISDVLVGCPCCVTKKQKTFWFFVRLPASSVFIYQFCNVFKWVSLSCFGFLWRNDRNVLHSWMAERRRPLVSCVSKERMACGWCSVNTTLASGWSCWSEACVRVCGRSQTPAKGLFPPFLNYWLYSVKVGAVWRGRLFHNKTIECFSLLIFQFVRGLYFAEHPRI